MSRGLTATGLVAIALVVGADLQVVNVDAAPGQTAAPQAATPAPAPRAATPNPVAAPAPDRAIFDRYCVSCHNERLKTGNLMLDKIDLTQIGAHAETLEKVVKKLRGGTMPPEGSRRPDAATLDAFIDSLEAALDRTAAASLNPGRVASRRLNRAEYVNVIHDLLGLEVDGTELLPSDMAGFGFDNNADVLSITPGLMSRYIAAATKISRVAVGSPDNRPIMQLYKVGFERRGDRAGEDLPFATHGGLAVRHTFPLDGEYAFTLRLKRNGTVSTIDGIEEDEHEIELRVDHALVKRFKIGGKFKGPDPGVLIAVPEDDLEGQKVHDYRMNADKELEVRLPIKAGTRLVSAAFTDSAPLPMPGGAQGRGGILSSLISNQPGVDMFYISGPFDGKTPLDTPSRRTIFTCRPPETSGAERGDGAPPLDRDSGRPEQGRGTRAQRVERGEGPPRLIEEACARKIISTLTRRAYRRPVTAADIDPLMVIYKEGRTARDFEAGIERALEALLSSPKFLIRLEREPAGARPGTAYRLNDLELASRLSFFLWKSIPDEELLDTAARGQLKDPAVLTRQVRRMLADRRSTRFMQDFVGQWLEIRNIQSKDPDGILFAAFDDTLRKAMTRETELFFENQVREDRPIPELLRANYTFLNEQLARHYGINDLYGSHFRRITLSDERRHGLLGHASVLMTTSYADRTSVVLRGKWVLENLLGAPPPPPPNMVPPLKPSDRAKPTSLRERMEQHRSDAVCASCHSRMDPLGFALENFDAIGKWRDDDGGAAINSTITLSGKTINGPAAFREALLSEGDGEFVRTVAEKLLTYALGRGVMYYDAPVVRQLERELARNESRWSALVLGIVRSAPFQMRRTSLPSETAPTTSVAQR
jgi:mono/diheme cytochrome c family protein